MKERKSAAAKSPSAAKVKSVKSVKSAREPWAGDVDKLIAGERGGTVTLGVPLAVFLGECMDCVRFIRQYWEPSARGAPRPGLVSAQKPGDGPASFNLDTADILHLLHSAVLGAQHSYLLATTAKKNASKLLASAATLLDDLSAALEWHFDDGVEDDRDAQLGALRAHHPTHGTIDQVAAALESYAALAEKYADELDGTLGFERAFIDEARKVAKQLLSINHAMESNPAAASALVRRNKLLVAMHARMLRTRKAASLVFRAHPAIARIVTSAYQRRARTAARRSVAPA